MTMLIEGVRDRIGEYIVSSVERLAKVQPSSEGFKGEFCQLLSRGLRPIIVSNHQSHADGFIMCKVVEMLRKLTSERGLSADLRFVMPVAASMVSGHQNKILQRVYHLTYEAMLRKGIMCLPYTRRVDEARYGLKSNSSEVKRMRETIANGGCGLIVFPEASVAGGRYITEGGGRKTRGMIEIADDALTMPYRLMRHSQQEGFFLPVGIDGSHRIFSPDTYAPKTWLAYLTFLGVGLHLASVRIGRPITAQELQSNLGDNWLMVRGELNRFVMGRVATLVPEHARGVYRAGVEFSAVT